ncbi:MAG TPA: hypothetical protein VGB94_03645 [Acidobacteriaceae bacterium]
MSRMHAELPYREVVNAPPPESAVHTPAHTHADAVERRKRLHHHIIDNVKQYVALVIVALAISIIVPLAVHFYRKHIAASTTTTTTTSAANNTTTTTTTAPASVDQVVQDPAGSMARTLISTGDTENDDSSGNENPQRHQVFAGKGRYQLYRQGNLTWRLDTDSGHTCILFATNEEWRNPRVSSHGCANE